VRLTDEEFAAVRARARECRRPLARYAREVLLGVAVRAPRGPTTPPWCAHSRTWHRPQPVAERGPAAGQALGAAPIAVTLRALLERLDAVVARP
jgi:hypothetical protein